MMTDSRTMGHARAAFGMVVVTLLWSTAGVVSRHLQTAESFEVTFFRSAFTLLGLSVALTWMRGPALWTGLLRSPRAVWISGLCWGVMFTAFMVALTMTRVANVLVTMAIGPLLTALFARLFLHHRLPTRTWVAIAVAGAGIAWMFGQGVQAADAASLAGMAVALAVPLATSINYTVLHHAGRPPAVDMAAADAEEARAIGEAAGGAVTPAADLISATFGEEAPDMLVAVLIGAALSSLATLPIAWPFRSTPHDLALLFGLGIFQLAIPCLLLVRLTRELPSAEISLLGLLEIIFGVLWAWLWAGEQPGHAALIGGALVIGALVCNELLSLRERTAQALPASAANARPGAARPR
jgi:drug/metabolite transporter (DMT)-like permease